MNRLDRRLSLLHRLAWLCVVTVLAVTTLSAFIRLSNAGLGCADWPQCYGERGLQAAAFTGARSHEVNATVVARIAHRVMAVAALLIIVLLIVVCLGGRPRLRGSGAIAVALLALALFLAVLGRWSSGARIPAVAMANLIGGFAMLALSLRLAIRTDVSPPRQRVAAVVALLLLVVQVGVGGLVSASHSGLSCVGWSDCIAAARDVPGRRSTLGASRCSPPGHRSMRPARFRSPSIAASPCCSCLRFRLCRCSRGVAGAGELPRRSSSCSRYRRSSDWR